MSDLLAITGARIFDGHVWHNDAALLVEFGHVSGIVRSDAVPANSESVHLDGGMLVPGFIDLQVNGGGGVLFNNAPTLESIRIICAAHAQFGTTALLPTLITDTVDINVAAIAAGKVAKDQGVPGFIGLHLEGPHLSLARKGTHDPALIRPMDEADLARLADARADLPNLLVTVAPETVTPEQIARLADAGIIVSIGHSDAGIKTAGAAFDAGASMATHLFNAMSQLGNREPGVVGAVLHHGAIHAGLIADGIHVHKAAIHIALRAKTGPGRIFLVTDSMSQTGTDIDTLTLNGRTITRVDGALRLADGTLAGADLNMIDAVAFMHSEVGLPLDEAIRMASLYPAEAMGIDAEFGHLQPGAVASFVHLSDARQMQATWINGVEVWRA
ncbi:N-acetylglucosamine-6-phosphate deacetylase [Devosia psychrophila]|uniref:N-acetylglucosamine-6-phosphate deacetylase n=1 Tax=Devosia psychrophila TaxID=728005 RepID=A0A0F5PUC5_9HYPH|nr:N-acetylglucosamine-6-phosphate deacetylase [Devosia psychrophila]KKC32006.1 N-acetylglucosamine-6-phosphate deacetylase [Devosia psychrophila]SFC75592.1 N-acetylglucosamine-6-phosphate deacetylase [Devosia psychrophila]